MHFRLVHKFRLWLGISSQPVIKLYDGFGDEDEVVIYGHVLGLSPLAPKRLSNNVFRNMFGLIRLFIVKPIKHAKVELEWYGALIQTETDLQGYFKFEWKPHFLPQPGWHNVKAQYRAPKSGLIACSANCDVFIPHKFQFGFISDIDDTFLVSHSSNMLKRLQVLFTKNAASRKAFDGVVQHYQLLSKAGAAQGPDNPFFYVSSSEYNLYDYIKSFCSKNQMPRGVFLLSEMKRLRHILKTAQGKHGAKYFRIVRILECFPHHQYVLFGDNSQMDPEIYLKIVQDFPGKIIAVYIRNVASRKDSSTKELLKSIEQKNIKVCYFKSSKEAILHSKEIGLL